ncbi:MAG: hypothetical protein AAGI24_06220 [Pseudomonadota bacterium]
MNAPQIRIHVSDVGVSVTQQRPDVTSLLRGLPVDEALLRIPLLLPICGQAQAIAAKRAIQAADGNAERQNSAHDLALYKEQAVAAAWRLAIDWPSLIEHERRLDLLKSVQDALEPADIARQLLAFVPALVAVDTAADLEQWLTSSECTAAEVIRHARRCEQGMHTPARNCLKEAALCALVEQYLATDVFDPLSIEHKGIEVGPLALQRHPLLAASPEAALSQRLVAQLLDTVQIARQLSDAPRESQHGRTLFKGLGLGQAMTARGPVYHRVGLGPERTVSDWRILAPTDWHFSPTGPFLQEAQACTNREQLHLLAAGFDPCAPWTVEAQQHA